MPTLLEIHRRMGLTKSGTPRKRTKFLCYLAPTLDVRMLIAHPAVQASQDIEVQGLVYRGKAYAAASGLCLVSYDQIQKALVLSGVEASK